RRSGCPLPGGGRWGSDRVELRYLPAAHVLPDALEQVDEALSTGIDHSGLAQDAELLWRGRQRAPRARQAASKKLANVIDAAAGHAQQLVGKILKHGRQRAGYRLGHGRPGRTRARGRNLRQVLAIERLKLPRRLAQALKVLRHDGARVAAGAVERGI